MPRTHDVRREHIASADQPSRVAFDTAEPDVGDPSVIQALNATRADLANLRTAQSRAMPESIARRIHDRIADQEPLITSADPKFSIASRMIAAAAAAVAVIAGVLVFAHRVDPQAADVNSDTMTLAAPAPPTTAANPIINPVSGDPTDSSLIAFMGVNDRGPLSKESTMKGCLAANGVDPSARILGSSQIEVRGQKATLLLLPGGRIGHITALVVGPKCSNSNADLVLRRNIGPSN